MALIFGKSETFFPRAQVHPIYKINHKGSGVIFNKAAYSVRLIICTLTLLFPILLWIAGGSEPNSYSEYYYTNAMPLFVLTLLLVSFQMLTTPKWFIPGILLLVVIFFPCKEYTEIHNFAAIVFYIASSIIICKDKRLYYIGYAMVLASPLYFLSLYFVEVVETTLLAIFHIRYIMRIRGLLN